jgi:GTP-binding protein HflX
MSQSASTYGQLLTGVPAILTAAILPGAPASGANLLNEMTSLADTAGAEVVGSLTQKLRRPYASTYLGSGKLEELSELIEETEARAALFDCDLSPAQVKNIEAVLKVRVLDRTEVILAIFASRARTKHRLVSGWAEVVFCQ